jgi:hypothetical protein
MEEDKDILVEVKELVISLLLSSYSVHPLTPISVHVQIPCDCIQSSGLSSCSCLGYLQLLSSTMYRVLTISPFLSLLLKGMCHFFPSCATMEELQCQGWLPGKRSDSTHTPLLGPLPDLKHSVLVTNRQPLTMLLSSQTLSNNRLSVQAKMGLSKFNRMLSYHWTEMHISPDLMELSPVLFVSLRVKSNGCQKNRGRARGKWIVREVGEADGGRCGPVEELLYEDYETEKTWDIVRLFVDFFLQWKWL